MRKLVASLLTVMLLVSLSIKANAEVKPGDSCKKLSQTSVSSGKTYTCIKSGSKLVWNSGTTLNKKVTSSSSDNACTGALHLGVATKERVSTSIAKFTYEALKPCSYNYKLLDSTGKSQEIKGPFNIGKTQITFEINGLNCNSSFWVQVTVFTRSEGSGDSLTFLPMEVPWCDKNGPNTTSNTSSNTQKIGTQLSDEPKIVPSPWLKPSSYRNGAIAPITSFTELSKRFLDFHYLAWAAAQDAAGIKENNPIDIKVYVGPNSQECSENAKRALQLMQNIYSHSILPPGVNLIVFDSIDKNWAINKTNDLLSQNFDNTNPSGNNPEGVVISTKYGILWSENACKEPDPNSIFAGDIAHGYTHSIQRFQFMASYPNFGWEKWAGVPRWLLEGGATFSENFTERGGSYYSWKNASQFHDSTIKSYSLQFFKDFLRYQKETPSNSTWSVTNAWPNQRSYDVGGLASEVLIAMKGPSVVMDLYSDFSKTRDFDVSFKNIFGVTWTEVEPEVATAIYNFVQATY